MDNLSSKAFVALHLFVHSYNVGGNCVKNESYQFVPPVLTSERCGGKGVSACTKVAVPGV